jgi:hypothetical protein
MDFGEAIRALKEGKYVSRAGWNGKNMYLYLEDKLSGRSDYDPCICMFTAQGRHQPGWLANQQDMLATDWGVVSR